MGLTDIISTLFPFRKYHPLGNNAPEGDDSGFYPNGVKKQSFDERLPDGRTINEAAQGGFYPQSGDTTSPTGNIDGKGVKPVPQFPVAQPATPPNIPDTPPAVPATYTDPSKAYADNGGTDISTPSFYPDAKGVKPATARQAAFEDRYNAEPLEQKQQDLIEGKAPVDHNVFLRTLKGAARGFARGGLGGAIAGGVGEGFFPSANRAMNAQEELGKVDKQIAARDQSIATRQKQDLIHAQTQNIYDDNTRQADALKEKSEMDKSRVAYWNRKADQGDLKQATNDDLIKLRDKWMTSKDANDKKRLTILEKELGERTRHDQATEQIAKTNEVGRNNRQQNSQDFKANLESLKTKAKAAFEQMKQAQGEQKAIRTVNQKFVDAYTRKNGHAPTQQEIDDNFSQIYGDGQ
jgi:hypothetical protein